jgi:hypothetical protein
MDYPRMLYRVGGPVALQDGDYDTLIVADEDADDAARADGWYETPAAARETGEKVRGDAPPDDAPPTRAELEEKARELGIKFDGRWGDRRLAAAIDAALKG